MNNNWSQWISFYDIDKYHVPQKSGVYKIRYFNKNINKPHQIQRLYGIDKEGILSIGESGNLFNRMWTFYEAIQPLKKQLNHAAAWYYVSFKYNRVFKKRYLQFSYMITQNKKEAERKEFILLAEYRNIFLDLPPLNNNPGKYPYDWKKIMKSITGILPPND